MSRTNTPLYALVASIVFVIAAVLLVLYAPPGRETVILGLIASTLPSLVAAFASERASRDIRNGVVEAKVREGTKTALKDTGVLDVVESSARGESTTLAMQALAKLLELNTAATETNTTIHNEEEGKHSGRSAV
jgi:hypothetical protein